MGVHKCGCCLKEVYEIERILWFIKASGWIMAFSVLLVIYFEKSKRVYGYDTHICIEWGSL